MKKYHEDYFNSCGGLMVLGTGYLGLAMFGYDYYFGDKYLLNAYKTEFFLAILLGGNSLWMTGRLLASKITNVKVISPSFKGFFLKNILAPIIVSLVVYAITGNPSITFISIPIFGALSATLGI